MEYAKDLLTQEFFIKSRSNQKFVTAQNRIRYNNQKARKKRIIKGPIDRMLDLNRTILNRIIGNKQEIVVSKDYLLGAEFNFSFCSYYKEINGVTFSGIYEYGIAKTSDNKYRIIRFDHGQTT